MMMMLAGCTNSTRAVLQPLPPLSADLAVTPPAAPSRAGGDARLELARNKKALTQCRAQYDDFKSFYERLRTPVKGASHGR
jgi:hypothetical protein